MAILVVFDCPPVYDLIFSCLDYPHLITLSKTCSAVKEAVSDFCPRAYNIDKHLSHFFDDPLGFRQLQCRTFALVSGSNVLQFFDRTRFHDADIDIFVHNEMALAVGSWILQQEGYEFFPTHTQKQTAGKGNPSFFDVQKVPRNVTIQEQSADYPLGSLVANVFTFHKGNKKVQLIGSMGSPLPCILAFHSTCVMNFFTHDRAYSLYPRATFIARTTIGVKASTAREKQGLKKYASRGWKVITKKNQARRSELENFFLNQERHPRDKHVWQLPFNIEGIDSEFYRSQHNPTLYNSWTIQHKLKESEPDYTLSSSHIIKHNLLSNTYQIENRKLAEYLRKLVKSTFEGVDGLAHPNYVHFFEDKFCKLLAKKFVEHFNPATSY